MLGWKKHMLESRLLGEISITSDMQMPPPLRRKWRSTKKPLDESESGEWKSWLKTQPSGNKDYGIWSHHFLGNRSENSGKRTDFIFRGSKITVDGDCSHEIKRFLLLGRKTMTNLDSIFKKQRQHFTKKGLISQSYGFSSSHVWMCDLDHKEG